MKNSTRAAGFAAAIGFGVLAAFAQPVQAKDLLAAGLMDPTTDAMTEAGAFKSEGPWTIGMSFPGLGNTWIVQMIQETKFEAAQSEGIEEFVFIEAGWQPAKQVADLEDLIARKVDAIIVAPIAPAVVQKQVEAAVAAGIPVITYGSSEGLLPSAVELNLGGKTFGQQGGEWLREKLGGEGTIWVFRGIAGANEDTLRYDGMVEALAGSNITIGSEVFGDWNYTKGKQLCENLVLSGQPVDGIWFSGADMTRACIDVFNDIGKPLVPMTGEGNNGFLRIWSENELDSVAPIYTPGIGPALVRATIALLEGEQLNKSYYSDPAPITNETLKDFYRADLSDAFWVTSTLPDAEVNEQFKR
ncbi:ABC transporter substrate-binding protein [Sulfitobacter guttiformis]|uniref:Monosaccharide ABC transporter substrate-binding protein (CUT2 family) n=1 Tax=Sulfitobacter guttiformis TaxID=74349 RepID=A0A420DUD7_9RHOB|nr:ABC transporter substrate-binding protein [Sulfitobacter guttiformis]KIN71316.1 ABC transporter substrate-binding protein [Sulfitobacter guttiformis KCTC 32187]RKE97769.1 monosaccharide ABC transporter substrate-binding protein (CUT2 family) [Sulfitobacter guttiformis]